VFIGVFPPVVLEANLLDGLSLVHEIANFDVEHGFLLYLGLALFHDLFLSSLKDFDLHQPLVRVDNEGHCSFKLVLEPVLDFSENFLWGLGGEEVRVLFRLAELAHGAGSSFDGLRNWEHVYVVFNLLLLLFLVEFARVDELRLELFRSKQVVLDPRMAHEVGHVEPESRVYFKHLLNHIFELRFDRANSVLKMFPVSSWLVYEHFLIGPINANSPVAIT